MTELSKIIKGYLISAILIVLTTIVFCGIFTAQNETQTMLFG